jgi:hypothetical protein
LAFPAGLYPFPVGSVLFRILPDGCDPVRFYGDAVKAGYDAGQAERHIFPDVVSAARMFGSHRNEKNIPLPEFYVLPDLIAQVRILNHRPGSGGDNAVPVGGRGKSPFGLCLLFSRHPQHEPPE